MQEFLFSDHWLSDTLLPETTNAPFPLSPLCCSLTVLHQRKNCICSGEEFCAEQWFRSSRTHLMPHWNPIITTMEQNELLLTWSAASWFRVTVTCPVCGVVAHFYPHLILILLTAFNSASPPPTFTHTHTHCVFSNAGHYRGQPLWPIRVWQPHLTRQAGPQLLRSHKHIRALRALQEWGKEQSCGYSTEKWEANDMAGWENSMKRNKESDRGNGIPFWAHHAIFCLMGYVPEECKDNL